MDRFDITLVNMPFAMPLIAPLGVGVLCGALRRAGWRVRCRFANIDLAERVPEELYDYPASNGLNVEVMSATTAGWSGTGATARRRICCATSRC